MGRRLNCGSAGFVEYCGSGTKSPECGRGIEGAPLGE